ncbi:MAG: type II toxin-antitoxin system VapC family toxin [bacterium]|nr:type II toxin-antitoxin system VapC family toxin [bacterium]
MKSYFLDTSTIINYLRGIEKAVNLINNLDGKITSSYLCLAELFEGVFSSNNKKAESIILQFFSGLNTTYGIDAIIAKKFGLLRQQLRKKGNIIEDIDIFIASTCLIHDLYLVTFNIKHFSRIKELKICEI